MKKCQLSHLTDQVLLQDLAMLIARGCTHTAEVVAHIGEVDSRKLFLPAGHSSMFSYCVSVLHFSEQAAYKRIRVARMARRFPSIYDALAEGRVHLSGMFLLKAFMTRRNVDELLAAVTHKSCREIEKILAERYPKEDVATKVRALPGARVVAATPAASPDRAIPTDTHDQLSVRTVGDALAEGERISPVPQSAVVPRATEPPAKPAKVEPLAPTRYALHLTMSQEMHDKLRHAQALLSHVIASGDVPRVLERALDELIAKLEKAKYAATEKPRAIKANTSTNPRQIPAHVKREVRERDGFQCTFVSESGQRCPERHFLQFDHIDPVSRGGKATTERMRLLCRAHNQYEAEHAFGLPFMQRKLHEAWEGRRAKRVNANPATARIASQ